MGREQVQCQRVVAEMEPLFEVVDFLLRQWRLVAHKGLTEGTHPWMVLIEALTAGHCAPRDEIMYVGVVGGILRGLVVDTRPDGCGQ